MSQPTADPDALRRRFAEADHAQFMDREDAIWDGLESEMSNLKTAAELLTPQERAVDVVNSVRPHLGGGAVHMAVIDAIAKAIEAGRQQQREIDAAVCRERAQKYIGYAGEEKQDSKIYFDFCNVANEAAIIAAAIEAGPLT